MTCRTLALLAVITLAACACRPDPCEPARRCLRSHVEPYTTYDTMYCGDNCTVTYPITWNRAVCDEWFVGPQRCQADTTPR